MHEPRTSQPRHPTRIVALPPPSTWPPSLSSLSPNPIFHFHYINPALSFPLISSSKNKTIHIKQKDYTDMKTRVEEKFSDFFEKWVSQLEELLQQLVQVSKNSISVLPTDSTSTNDSEMQALVSKVTAHVKAYYTAKWAAAHEDVLAFFCPVWLTPLENAYQWVTGWKPSTVFQLLESLRKSSNTALRGLSEQQVKKVEELRVKIRLEEEKVEREMERQQVAMADRRMVELVRLAGCRGGFGGGGGGDRVEGLVEVALKGMFAGLERVLKAADCVRLKTLKELLKELSPLQCVEFLAATSMFQLQLRHLGKKRICITSNNNYNNNNNATHRSSSD